MQGLGEYMLEVLGRIGFGLFGLAVLIGIVWLFSNNRRAIDWKLVATGITLQIAFAALVLLVPGGRSLPAVLDRQTGRLRYFNFGNKGQGGSFVAADESLLFAAYQEIAD